MLTEICLNLRNWFCKTPDKHIGTYTIEDGRITPSLGLQEGQYYRIIGSVFNDGVRKYTTKEVMGEPTSETAENYPEDFVKHKKYYTLQDETFEGALWLMRIPKEVVDLADEIEAWDDKNGRADSVNMSPLNSESFVNYSYSKSGSKSASGGSAVTWQEQFGKRLNAWRKL